MAEIESGYAGADIGNFDSLDPERDRKPGVNHDDAEAVGYNESKEQQLPAEADDEYFRATFGITRGEAEIPIKYGNYSGCLGMMLIDKDCPEGEKYQEAHQEGGREAVLGRLDIHQTHLGVELGKDGKTKASDLPKELPPVDETKKKQT